MKTHLLVGSIGFVALVALGLSLIVPVQGYSSWWFSSSSFGTSSWSFWVVPRTVTIPASTVVADTFNVELGSLTSGSTFYFSQYRTLADDIYGSHTGQGVIHKYVVTLTNEWRLYNTVFHVGVTSYGGMGSGNTIFVKMDREPAYMYTWIASPPRTIQYAMILRAGTYTFYVGFLSLGQWPAYYRIAFA